MRAVLIPATNSSWNTAWFLLQSIDAVCTVIFQKCLHALQQQHMGLICLYCRNILNRKINFLQKSTETFFSLKTPQSDETRVYIEFDSFLEKSYVQLKQGRHQGVSNTHQLDGPHGAHMFYTIYSYFGF